MVILDTDHLSVLEWESPEAERLRTRLKGLSPDEAAATIISFEEQMRGWLAALAKARTLAQQVDAYGRLLRQLRNYCAMRVLAFSERAAAEFQRLKKLKLRLGTMDLKIAAVVLAEDTVLLSQPPRLRARAGSES